MRPPFVRSLPRPALPLLVVAPLVVALCALSGSAQEAGPSESERVRQLEVRLATLELELRRQLAEIRGLRARVDRLEAEREQAAPAEPERATKPTEPARDETPKAATREPLLDERAIEALVARGELLAAIGAARRRIDASPEDASCYVLLARVYLADGNQDQACARLRQAIELDPKHVQARLLLAELLAQQRDHEQARAIVERLLAEDASPPAQVYCLRGYLRLRERPPPKLREAVEDFSRAVQLDPSLARAYYLRGVAYYESGRFEDAVRDLERARELFAPTEADAHDALYVLGACFARIERWDRAASALEAFLDQAPAGHPARPRAAKLLSEARSKR